jgi:hypothetical protein
MFEGIFEFLSIFLRIAIFSGIGKVIRLLWKKIFVSQSPSVLKKRKTLYGDVINVEEYKDRIVGIAFTAVFLIVIYLCVGLD